VSSATPTAFRAKKVVIDKRHKHLHGEENGEILEEYRREANLKVIGFVLVRRAATIGRERLIPFGPAAHDVCDSA